MTKLKLVIVPVFGLLAMSITASATWAAESVSFAGKTITMTVGYAPGGGVDAMGRLLAQYMAKRLPGTPTIIVRNMPGAGGIISLNWMVTQTKPDGLTFALAASTEIDPVFRPASAIYDASKFEIVGGTAKAGTGITISKAAMTRLTDPNGEPVTMGAPGAVRSAMQLTLWGSAYLGWHTKWVLGYRGTKDMKLALERGEIDMTGLGVPEDVREIMATGKFVNLIQSGLRTKTGYVPTPAYEGAPLITDLLKDKLTTSVEKQGLQYTLLMTSINLWVSLKEGTPAHIVAAYRKAYHETFNDPDFIEKAKKIIPDLVEVDGDDMHDEVTTLAELPPEVIAFMKAMGEKQGVASSD
jgi:tripartite-type tricarboxylate transporter receptor subunit TctC